jgi:hypothetical protein
MAVNFVLNERAREFLTKSLAVRFVESSKEAVNRMSGVSTETALPKTDIGAMADGIMESLVLKKGFLSANDPDAEKVFAEENTSKMKDALIRMLASPIDFGTVDPANEQQLLLFYHGLKAEISTDEDDGVLLNEEIRLLESVKFLNERFLGAPYNSDEANVWSQKLEDAEKQLREIKARRSRKVERPEAEKLLEEQQEKWSEYQNVVQEKIGGGKIYKLAILGAGAATANYLVSAGATLDPSSTIVIGDIQPWKSLRGPKGVVNQSLLQMSPRYNPSQLDGPTGLAAREKFSEVIAEELKRFECVEAKLAGGAQKVTGGDVKFTYYKITTNKGDFYAQKTIGALGVGQQKAPEGVTGSGYLTEGQVKDGENDKEVLSRMMSMDTFKRAVDDGRFKDTTITSVVVIGPNAAIDILSTLKRDLPNLEVYWVASKRGPAFLMGTDNEHISDVFNETKEKGEKDPKKDIYKSGGMVVISYDYLSAAVNKSGVTVTYGHRAEGGGKAKPCGKQVAELAVYGVGADVDGLAAAVFPTLRWTDEDKKNATESAKVVTEAFFGDTPKQYKEGEKTGFRKVLDDNFPRLKNKTPEALKADLFPEFSRPVNEGDLNALVFELFPKDYAVLFPNDPNGKKGGFSGVDGFADAELGSAKEKIMEEIQDAVRSIDNPGDKSAEIRKKLKELIEKHRSEELAKVTVDEINGRVYEKVERQTKEKRKNEIKLVPIYDVDQHFNFNPVDPKYNPEGKKSPKEALTDFLKTPPSGRKPMTDKDATKRVEAIEKIIGKAGKWDKGSEEVDGLGSLAKAQEKLPRRLPSVIGVKVANDSDDDPTAMEFLGASGRRLAENFKVSYSFASQGCKKILNELNKIKSENRPYGVSEQLKFFTELEAVAIAIETTQKNEDLAGLVERLGKLGQCTALDPMPTIVDEAKNIKSLLEELFNRRAPINKEGVRELARGSDQAHTTLEGIANTLPQNFVGGDQTGPVRSSIQAGQNYMPEDLGKDANFIGADQTQISAHIAIHYPNIPHYLADVLTARIVFERRQRRLDEAPLPRPEVKGDANTKFHLYQQIEFQEGWNDKLGEIDKVMAGETTEDQAQSTLETEKKERKRQELISRVPLLEKRINDMVADMSESVNNEEWRSVSEGWSKDPASAVKWLQNTSITFPSQSLKELATALVNSINTHTKLKKELEELQK